MSEHLNLLADLNAQLERAHAEANRAHVAAHRWRVGSLVLLVLVASLAVVQVRGLRATQDTLLALRSHSLEVRAQLRDEREKFARCHHANEQLVDALRTLDARLKARSCAAPKPAQWVHADAQ